MEHDNTSTPHMDKHRRKQVDDRTIKKAIKGSKKAFGQLIKEWQTEGYRMAYSFTRNEAEGQDVLGNAIEKAYNNIHTVKEPKKVKQWFMAIVANEARMLLRKEKRNSAETIDETTEHIEVPDIDLEGLMDLELSLDSLSGEQQSVLRLKYEEGYTFREIGEILEMAESTVKKRIYHALRHLKEKLEVKGGHYGKIDI